MTKYLDLKATIKWANSQYSGLFTPDPKYADYKANFYLDPESWEKFKKAGIQLKTYNDEDGDYVRFKRKHQMMIKNKLETLGPPKVFFVEGIQPTKDIGNGSSVIVTVEVFPTGNGVGHRLNRVVVTDLVEYVGGAMRDEKLTQYVPEGAEEEVEVVNDFDDEIPFAVDDSAPSSVEVKAPKKASPFRR